MKQIYLIDEHLSSKQNGVGTYVRHFARMFDGADYNVNILSFNAEVKELCISVQDGVYKYSIPYCAQGNFMKAGELICPLLSLYIEDKKDNVFFVNHSPCSDFMKAIRANFPKSKIVFTIHDQGWTSPLLGNSENLRKVLAHRKVNNIDNDTVRYVRNFCKEEKKMYQIADAVICLSHSTYQLLHEVYGASTNKLYYIPNCFIKNSNGLALSKKEARAKLYISEKEKILLFVGRPTKAKGIFELLKTFEQICATFKDIRLVVAGEVHSLGDFTKLTPTSSSHITYTGLLNPEQLNLWYAAADIGVLPSYTEQCSYTALEMLYNIGIVVSTDGWGLNEIFHNSQNAIVAQTTTINDAFTQELVKAIEIALTLDCESVRELQIKSKMTCDRFSDLKIHAHKYKQLVNRITNG
ncbi:glycosyltransferase family 4 protein [Prevotellamassilia timonensis]|uniref:glycosyltransferase family 4 protein n=1 Tax=Prevotellamassilia timonensis TaxID=1852370 RepID=UPI003FF098A6